MPDSKPGKNALEGIDNTVTQLIRGASDAAFAIDDQRRIVAWNNIAQQLLDYIPEEVIGRRCEEVLQAVLPGGEPLCTPNCELFRCFCNSHPRGVSSCRIRRKDGNWVSVGYSSLVIPGSIPEAPSGAVVAIVFLREEEEQHTQTSRQGLLQIFALGNFGLAANGNGIEVGRWKRRQAVTLLKFLLTHLDRPVHRERILDCLWPNVDEQRGWGRLKVTMYYLRTQLRERGVSEDALRTVGNAYLLRRDAVWVDAENFEKQVTEGRAFQIKGQIDDALRCFDAAQFLYRGAYLEQDVYADWCAEERERLGEILMEMLTRKAECHAERREFVEAAQVCRKGLVHDPCRESFHFSLMLYLVHLGRADWAITQYRHCKNVLRREFGVDPMPETKRLYQQILTQQRVQDSAAQTAPFAMTTISSARN